MTDAAYQTAGATIVDRAAALAADLVLAVRAPAAADLGQFKKGAAL